MRVRYVKIPEEDRVNFKLPVDSAKIGGKPLRDFLVDKDADFVIFTTVANCYIEPEPEPIKHIVVCPDKGFYCHDSFDERITDSFNGRIKAYTMWRRLKCQNGNDNENLLNLCRHPKQSVRY